MTRVLALLLIFLPQRLKHVVARRLLGWEIHPTAYIGRSLVMVPRVTMEEGAQIGHLNVIRDFDELRMAKGASIASRNWIVGVPSSSGIYSDPRRDPSLVMGEYAVITTAHDLDVTDRIELGKQAAIAGFRSAILTHNLNLVTDRFGSSKVTLGDYGVLMSGCTLQSGTNVPARSIVSAGSVVATKLNAELTLYRGNPAEPVRELPERLKFFHREGRQAQIEAEVRRWMEKS
ncbi:acyltransferase [Nocardioides sp. J54]|uniref:acyltransferase n=1 Tax=Nocardioides sp. J54 TaxID=935866 RepID=UPI0004B26878|nr:hypothetical protein [Nocardioides sp. J54]